MLKNSARGGGAPAEEDSTNRCMHMHAFENYIDERVERKEKCRAEKLSPYTQIYMRSN